MPIRILRTLLPKDTPINPIKGTGCLAHSCHRIYMSLILWEGHKIGNLFSLSSVKTSESFFQIPLQIWKADKYFDLIVVTKFNFPLRILSNISDRHYTWLHLKTHYFWCLLLPLQHHIFASKSSDDWLITFSAKQQLFRPDWK